ncbi:hypothetical protein N7462_001863 [Penicillium macrosclerotiorum]|uniref:uncharacterized protein n=1 Tax=Penicillium macrosclerotiorum TaxID=303699 RepID=UPI002549B289|nr:uncharacterized protein N7462_001863 [Penicillium macrosclerotiorum]KAJ5692440.1 hypothetical protein N7462_001863 [Penicillium macrosclerotiorum]
MRILCLHGHGTSPDVMKYQMSALARAADASWEFHYLGGEEACLPAPDIGGYFPEPYFCYSRNFDQESEDAAHALLEETISQKGPFDGAFGFSQGASILVSYLIEQKMAYPNNILPFQFVILCSVTVPLASSLEYHQLLLGSLTAQDEARIRSCRDEEIAQLPIETRTVIAFLVSVLDATETITHESRSYFLDRPLSKIPSMLHPDICDIRLELPVLHVRGKTELPAIRDSGFLVERFFKSGKQRVFEHTAGHDVPRSGPEARRMLSAMEWVIAQSQLPTY